MRVFVTGAPGFIGSAIVGELQGAGFHGFPDFSAALTADLRAVETMGAALEGTGKPFIITAHLRGEASTNAALSLAGVRSSVVSLSLSVHGEGDQHGFVPRLIAIAREKGVSAYIGDGSNRWTAVHRLDAAHLFRLALEAAPAGSQLDGVGDEGVPFRDIADVIGRQLVLPVVSISPEEADAHFGAFLGAVAARDLPRSSTRTQELLGWRPTHPALIPDIVQHYFNS